MEDWYNMTVKKVWEHDGGNSWLCRYNGSLIKALKEVYPEINESKFLFKSKGFWNSKDNKLQHVKMLEERLSILGNYKRSLVIQKILKSLKTGQIFRYRS
jgi:hypothetical protein